MQTKNANRKPYVARNAVALIVNADCGRCGGSLIDDRTSSHDLTSDTTTAVCEDCGALNDLGKLARLFA